MIPANIRFNTGLLVYNPWAIWWWLGKGNVAATFVNIYRQSLAISQKSITMCHNKTNYRLYPKSSKHSNKFLLCQTVVKYMWGTFTCKLLICTTHVKYESWSMLQALNSTRKFHKSFKALHCLCYIKNKVLGTWPWCLLNTQLLPCALLTSWSLASCFVLLAAML